MAVMPLPLLQGAVIFMMLVVRLMGPMLLLIAIVDAGEDVSPAPVNSPVVVGGDVTMMKTDDRRPALQNISHKLFITPNTPASGWLENVVLCYMDNRADSPTHPLPLTNPYTGYPPDDQKPNYIWSPQQFKSLLAFVRPDGTVVDTLFDTFLFTGVAWTGGHSLYPAASQRPTTQHDWLSFLGSVQLHYADKLNIAAAEVRSALPKAPFRPKVLLTIPYPWDVLWEPGTSWGNLSGRPLHFENSNEDRAAAVNWWVDEAVRLWNAQNFTHIELAGFYWLVEGLGHDTHNTLDSHLLPVVAAHIHSKPDQLIFTWCPGFEEVHNAAASKQVGYDDGIRGAYHWRDLGFDVAVMQPNYMLGNKTMQHWVDVANYTQQFGLGIEMELQFDSTNYLCKRDWTINFDRYAQASVLYGFDRSVRMWEDGK